MSKKLSKQIVRWNKADYLLYQHFNRTFWKRVEKHGKSFWEDVAEFRRMKELVYEQCSVQSYEEHAVNVKVPVMRYKLGAEVLRFHEPFCQRLFISEVEYIKRFKKQYRLEIASRRNNDLENHFLIRWS